LFLSVLIIPILPLANSVSAQSGGLTVVAIPTSGYSPLHVTFHYTFVNNIGFGDFDYPPSHSDCGALTYVSGDANGDAKVNEGETWKWTCATVFTETTTTRISYGKCIQEPQFLCVDFFPEITITILPVGGEILGIDLTSLFVAGAFANSGWLIPIAGVAAAGIVGFAIRKRIK